MAREGELAVPSGACWATICGSESVIGGGRERELASVRARPARGLCDCLAEGSQVLRAGAGVRREPGRWRGAAAAARQSEQVAYRSGRV